MIDTLNARESDRQRLAGQISRYLASGGQIHPLPGNTRTAPWPARPTTIDPATRLKRRPNPRLALKKMARQWLAREDHNA